MSRYFWKYLNFFLAEDENTFVDTAPADGLATQGDISFTFAMLGPIDNKENNIDV